MRFEWPRAFRCRCCSTPYRTTLGVLCRRSAAYGAVSFSTCLGRSECAWRGCVTAGARAVGRRRRAAAGAVRRLTALLFSAGADPTFSRCRRLRVSAGAGAAGRRGALPVECSLWRRFGYSARAEPHALCVATSLLVQVPWDASAAPKLAGAVRRPPAWLVSVGAEPTFDRCIRLCVSAGAGAAGRRGCTAGAVRPLASSYPSAGVELRAFCVAAGPRWLVTLPVQCFA